MSDLELPLGTILIAGDEEETREALARPLRSQGYRVLAARDHREMMHLVQTQPVDLALLDVRVPRAGGFAVCRELKSRSEMRLVPVVLVIGTACADDRIRAIEAAPTTL